jgi:uncharacterized Fe-S cluster-containing radical SAM superfamily protein
MSDGWLHACTRCREPKLLLVRLNQDLLCAACWNWMGRPYPKHATDPTIMEVATREKMLARGGTDRYRVRAGKS